MGDYLGGYFSQKFFDAEIYDILIQVPEVSGYLAAEWARFKNDKRNKVPKDAKMSKIWAKKAIFNVYQLRILAESLILGKYNVTLDEDGHITKDTPRPIKERKKIDTSSFYELLQGLRDKGKLNVLKEDIEPHSIEQYVVPQYFMTKLEKLFEQEPEKTYTVTEQQSPLEKMATNIQINPEEMRTTYFEQTGFLENVSKEQRIIQLANELIRLAEEIKRTLQS